MRGNLVEREVQVGGGRDGQGLLAALAGAGRHQRCQDEHKDVLPLRRRRPAARSTPSTRHG